MIKQSHKDRGVRTLEAAKSFFWEELAAPDRLGRFNIFRQADHGPSRLAGLKAGDRLVFSFDGTLVGTALSASERLPLGRENYPFCFVVALESRQDAKGTLAELRSKVQIGVTGSERNLFRNASWDKFNDLLADLIWSIARQDQGSKSEPTSDLPESQQVFFEGRVMTTRTWERKGRAQCLASKGTRCVVCGFDFGLSYGAEYASLIEVHHVIPYEGFVREVDPVKDLAPVCPNCHALIHCGRGSLDYRTIKEAQQILKVVAE
ncbi:MAG: HNH endonuclease [Armatimonadetes bacterium]|nr:HNH endonuclease [Armatimonadota bacterium]